MDRFPLWRGICALLVFLILTAGCVEEIADTPTVPPSAPSPSPTMSPAPSATPEGALPSVLAELDLGASVGDAYGPMTLAVDGDTAYVLCRHYKTLDAETHCVAVMDLEAGIVRDLWPLHETPTGSLAAGNGQTYLVYEGEGGEHLLSLDAVAGRKVHDVDLRSLGHVDGMWMDSQRGRLYLSLPDRVQVRDGRQLNVIDELVYPFEAVERHVVLTEDMNTLLLSVSNVLYAYDLPELTPRWQVETPLQSVQALVIDRGGESLMAQGPSPQREGARRVLFYDLAQGSVSGGFTLASEQEDELVWSDIFSGRLVFAHTMYPPAQFPILQLWSSDLEGREQGIARRFGSGLLAGGHGSALYILERRGQRMIAVEGPTLETDKSIPLGVELHDLVVDRNRQRLYVNDTGGTLYELDAAHLQNGMIRPERSLSAGGGEMVLDDQNELLLVAQGDGFHVSVVDVKDFSVTHVITGGDRIALDTGRARAIVGSRDDGYRSGTGGVRVWDLMRGERVGVISEGGVPAYNALRDEIYVAAYGTQVYDGSSLERVGSLTPDIDVQPCRGCTGSQFVRDLEVRPDLGVLALRMGTTTGGKGPGTLPLPRFFSLDTLAPVTHTVSVLAGVNGEGALLPPMDGRVYEDVRYVRDTSHANLLVRKAESGEVISWRDGLLLEMLSPDGAQGFVPRDDRWLVLDTETWTPLGYMPRYRVHSYGEGLGLFYALEGSRLVVLRPRGGEPSPPAAAQQASLRAGVSSLRLSPRYDEDKALFVVSENALYRSHTDGRDWVRLEGGLPHARPGAGAHMVLTISPDYVRDQTLFAGGWDGDGQGFGVWRSLDGGDTWQPMWRGLTHLQLERIVLARSYDSNGTVLAYCRYRDLRSEEGGRSVFRSLDRGETWEMIAQVTGEEELPQPAALLGEEAEGEAFRAAEGSRVLTPGGDSESPELALPPGEFVVAQRRSPFYREDETVYVLSSLGLYRTTNGGGTWVRAQEGPFAERRLEARFTDLDVSVGQDENVLLALGDRAGHVYLIRAKEVTWEPVPPSP